MTSLSRTAIEYGTHVWPLVTGCDHGPQECAVADKCWARGAYRLHKYDFTPTLHPGRLMSTMPAKPSRILVSFTGDMFSDHWLHPERVAAWNALVEGAKMLMRMHPQHSYLWLTKNPRAYLLHSIDTPWPSNAWLGASITGAESEERQADTWFALVGDTGHTREHTWISYEPIMGPLSAPLYDVSWLVIGGFSGRKRLTPEQTEWATDAIRQAERLGIPVFEKNNCGSGYNRRELPEGMVK